MRPATRLQGGDTLPHEGRIRGAAGDSLYGGETAPFLWPCQDATSTAVGVEWRRSARGLSFGSTWLQSHPADSRVAANVGDSHWSCHGRRRQVRGSVPRHTIHHPSPTPASPHPTTHHRRNGLPQVGCFRGDGPTRKRKRSLTSLLCGRACAKR